MVTIQLQTALGPKTLTDNRKPEAIRADVEHTLQKLAEAKRQIRQDAYQLEQKENLMLQIVSALEQQGYFSQQAQTQTSQKTSKAAKLLFAVLAIAGAVLGLRSQIGRKLLTEAKTFLERAGHSTIPA